MKGADCLSADQNLRSPGAYTLDVTQSAPAITEGDFQLGGASPQGETIAFTNYYVTRNGRPVIPVMGEFHFSRFPRQYWEPELRKIQAGGVTIVSSYIFWIQVEEEEGIFDWSGDRDVRAFVEACHSSGLEVLLRIGPFAHGEFRNGGLPDWLYGRAVPVRSNNERYLFYVRRYFAEVAEQVKGLLFQDGGPIIGIQLENEYMHAGAPWEVTFRQGSEWVPGGSDGVAHLQALKDLALEAGLHVPIYSCTAWGEGTPVPEYGFLPMQGSYAFRPWSPDPTYQQEPTREFLFRDCQRQPIADGNASYDGTRYPYAHCELGGGIQITYHHRPIVPAESVQAHAIVTLGGGANWLGYYMYHGGSNPVGKHTYLNEFTIPRISYDFQAPVREYGQLNESYHRLRALHLFLDAFGETLAPMAVTLPEHADQIAPEDTERLRYAVRSKDGAGFVFLNNYQDHVAMRDHEGVRLRLELPEESLVFPQAQGLTLRQGVSAILPFNLRLDGGVLLKYATAQVLTRLRAPEQTTYVFFAPEGMHAEFALDRATYQTIEVTGTILHEDHERGYVVLEPGLGCCVQITAADGRQVHLLVLTQAQAHACWKGQLGGQERLILSNALVLLQGERLELSWRGQETASLAIYPPLKERVTASAGALTETADGFFQRYTLTLPAHKAELSLQQLSADSFSLSLPATLLNGSQDAFLFIDYLGDMGHAYLDGRLVSDHFFHGAPWEIGLKRFVRPEREQELIVRISPLRPDAAAVRYLPGGLAFGSMNNGTPLLKVNSITLVPEYQAMLALQS
jgi:beta-galactosidase